MSEDNTYDPYSMPWMDVAKSHIGLKEIPGSRSNPTILQWAEDVNVENVYKNDDVPWCGLFIAHCIIESDNLEPVKDPLWALNWNKFGIKTTPRFGCIMVFKRGGGGHVGFYVGEDSDTYHILGGNQSNSVNVTRVRKSQFVGARWPEGYEEGMAESKKIVKAFSGKVPVFDNKG